MLAVQAARGARRLRCAARCCWLLRSNHAHWLLQQQHQHQCTFFGTTNHQHTGGGRGACMVIRDSVMMV
jgi:hypothetical protein